MKNSFGKENKWKVTIIIVVLICIACGKEKDEQKVLASVIGIEYPYDSQNNEKQIPDSHISKIWDMFNENSDDFTENDATMSQADEESTENVVETAKTDEDGNKDEQNEESYSHSNAYFYEAEETVHTYEGYFYLHSYTDLWQDVELYITQLKNFSDGTLYTLELEQPESEDPYDNLLDRKYIGYFYVTDETIYFFSPNSDGYTDENNNRFIEQIKSDETKFLEESATIICCENGTDDITDENGYHAYVEVDGEKRIFRYYNDYFYGSKSYLLVIWEKGKGITYYIHGNGNKNMHVEFGNNIKEEQKKDYGYPYIRFH